MDNDAPVHRPIGWWCWKVVQLLFCAALLQSVAWFTWYGFLSVRGRSLSEAGASEGYLQLTYGVLIVIGCLCWGHFLVRKMRDGS